MRGCLLPVLTAMEQLNRQTTISAAVREAVKEARPSSYPSINDTPRLFVTVSEMSDRNECTLERSHSVHATNKRLASSVSSEGRHYCYAAACTRWVKRSAPAADGRVMAEGGLVKGL
ncbi:hypothetical protein J6590_092027 [Homalodisca vitripennis]|nr:hypothetical protein J6590_092027 [Homalodisca vitripennis]